MTLGVLAYIPPPGVGHPEVFLSHLKEHWPSGVEVILYSDHLEWGGLVKVDCIQPSPKRRPWLANNSVFLTGLKLAGEAGWTHMLYLESDCRVFGSDWAERMRTAFLLSQSELGCPAIMGGSPVIYNPSSTRMEGLNAVSNFICDTRRRGLMSPTIYQGDGAPIRVCNMTIIYPNGAGSILAVPWLAEWFRVKSNPIPSTASMIPPWDMAVGHAAWHIHGLEAFKKFAHIPCAYSAFGNTITTEEERIKMLVSGDKVLIHQVKSDWKPNDNRRVHKNLRPRRSVAKVLPAVH